MKNTDLKNPPNNKISIWCFGGFFFKKHPHTINYKKKWRENRTTTSVSRVSNKSEWKKRDRIFFFKIFKITLHDEVSEIAVRDEDILGDREERV